MLFNFVVALMLAFTAQPAADFTGTWKMIPDRSGSPGQSVPITAMTFVIVQDGDQIRIDSTSGSDKTISASYPFGPPPTGPSEPLSANQARAYWQGDTLVVERGGTISGQTVSSKQLLRLNAERSELTVERTVIVQHGYTLKDTPNYGRVTDVFKRAQ